MRKRSLESGEILRDGVPDRHRQRWSSDPVGMAIRSIIPDNRLPAPGKFYAVVGSEGVGEYLDEMAAGAQSVIDRKRGRNEAIRKRRQHRSDMMARAVNSRLNR